MFSLKIFLKTPTKIKNFCGAKHYVFKHRQTLCVWTCKNPNVFTVTKLCFVNTENQRFSSAITIFDCDAPNTSCLSADKN